MDASKFNLLGEEINIKDVVARKGFLKGKKIVCYGDSTAANDGSYINKLISDYNLNIDNKAIGGHSLVGDYNDLLQADFSNYDYVILNYGINDWQASAPLRFAYQYDDKIGFLDALENILEKISNQNKVAFIILPWFCVRDSFENNINECLCTIDGYIDNAIDVINKFHFPYINLWKSSGINKYNYKSLMENSGDIYVHAIEPITTYVADMIFNGCINNGKCHSKKYNNTLCFINNGFNSYDEITTSLGGYSNKPYSGFNLHSHNDINVISSKFYGNFENDFITIEGVLTFTGNLALFFDDTLIRYLSPNTWRYGQGFFSFSIDTSIFKNKKLFFKVQSDKNGYGGYLMGTHIYTDNSPLELFFSDETKIPFITSKELLNNIEEAVFFKNGFLIKGFTVKNVNAETFGTVKETPKNAVKLFPCNYKNANDYKSLYVSLYANREMTFSGNASELYIPNIFVETSIV